MGRFLCALFMFGVLVGNGFVLGSDTSNQIEGDPSTTLDAGCSQTDSPRNTPVKRMLRCAEGILNLFKTQMKSAETAGERRDIFKLYCEIKPFSQCLATLKNHVERCGPAMNASVTVATESLEGVLEVVCEDKGARSLVILEEYANRTDHQMQVFMQCFEPVPIGRLLTLDETVGYVYGILLEGRMRIQIKGVGVFTSLDEIVSTITDILGKLKCMHPEQHTIMPCDVLVPQLQSEDADSDND